MIEMRRAQLSFGDGLIVEEVSDLREDWMKHADQVLADEQIVTAVYEALRKRHPKSGSRGRLGTPAETVLRLLILKHVRNWSYEVLEREARANLVYRDFTRDEQELYEALDWLRGEQGRIEQALARRHLRNGTLVLYDVTSTYFEGRTCPLAKLGYGRDGKRHKLQIVFGLLCTAKGCPVAVEVFEGNVGDPSTLASQIDKLKRRFGIERVVLVGDRGMITAARLEQTIIPAGLNFITALRAPAIRILAEAGAIQLSLFDERDLAEISSPDYPGERLVACRNPLLADERARKRQRVARRHRAGLAGCSGPRPTPEAAAARQG